MSEQAIIIRDDARMAVNFSAEAEKLKEQALSVGALVGKVTNADEQNSAVAAQTELQKILSIAEKARKACKAPVLDFGRKIDAAADKFIEELKAEMLRISMLVGNFQQLEQAKARAAEQAQRLEAEKIERERLAELRRIADAEAQERLKLQQAELEQQRQAAAARNKQERQEAEKLRLELERQKAAAAATSHDALDAVQEHFNQKAAENAAQTFEPVRAEGQRVAADWEITVTDIHKLYRAHANCVELKPRLSEIKSLLKMGVTVAGIIAKPIVKAGVRLGAERPAIDV